MHNFANTMKTAILLGGMIALFVAVGSFWGQQGMIIGLLFGGAMNVIAWFFSDKIAIAAMRAKEVDAQSAPRLYASVERLAANANLPMPGLHLPARRRTRSRPGARPARRGRGHAGPAETHESAGDDGVIAQTGASRTATR